MSKIIKKETFERTQSLETRLEDHAASADVAAAKRLLADVSKHVAQKEREGYEIGYQEGLAEATERLSAIAKLEDEFLVDVEQKIMRMVYDLAEKVLCRELDENKYAIIEMVKGALRELSGAHLVIRVHPKDLELVKASERELLTVMHGMSTILFKEDESIATGGCVIESEIGTIDARLDVQLAAIKRALGIA